LIGHRVLAVDDNQMVADCIADSLDLLGAEVRVAYDGTGALSVCEHWRRTAVLMDIHMPGMDGCEVARRMRECFRGVNSRLIALSGSGLGESDNCAKSAAFDLRLIKPVHLQELVVVLSK
jgi:two-component system, sensor histidine kinase